MKFLIILVIMIYSNSCTKEILSDDKLSLVKTIYSGNQLRIDGYYFQEMDNNVYTIYFFYADGTVLYGGGSFPISEIENHEVEFTSQEWITAVKKSKIRWGLFQIEGNNLLFERWYPSSGGPMPAYIRSGEILNDTTFVITKSVRPKTGEEKELNEVYHFRAFSPKPDSTNSFIR